VVLLDARDRLLPGFAPRASAYAEKTLRARGVEVRLGTQVASVSRAGVTLADGSKIAAAVVIWVAGVTVEGTLASGLAGLRGQNGRLVVEPDLSLAFHPEVFVVGDAAVLRSPGGGTEIEGGRSPSPDGPLVPQVAQAAIQSGDHAARQILNRVSGKETTRFVYHDKGMMATVGRRAAIAQLRGGAMVRGMPGWLAWLSLYLIGFRNRVVVLVNWAWRYCKWPAGLCLIVGDVEHRLGGRALRCPECRRSAPQRP
jgi:NADH dehydrogenase